VDGKHKFIKNAITYVVQVLQVTISANIALLPVILYQFQNIPVNSLVSNLVLSPLFAVVLIFSFVSALVSIVFPIPAIVGNILNGVVELFLWATHMCASIPYGNVKGVPLSFPMCAVYYMTFLAIRYICEHKAQYPRVVKWVKKRLKGALGLVCIVVIIGHCIQVCSREFCITMIDVGQGDSTLIQTRKGVTMLIDGGGEKEGSDFKVGERITLPYLLHRNIKTIDYVMVSHFDSDHSAGLFPVLENCRVKNVVIGKQGETSRQYIEFCRLAKKRGCRILEVKKGDVIDLDSETVVKVLYPDTELIKENVLNNNSLVCRVEYKTFSMLFTGDIEAIAERKIVEEYGKNHALKVSMLKVAHHGSKGSSTKEFLEATGARVALIGVGRENRFGHPSKEVLKKLEGRHMQIFRTDVNGEIRVMVQKDGKVRVKTFVK